MNLMKKRFNNKGFTLVELIIVVAVIAILATVLAPQYIRYVERSREANDAQIATSIMDAATVAINDPQNHTSSGEIYRVIWFTTQTPVDYGWSEYFQNTGSARNSIGAIAVGPGEGFNVYDFWLGQNPPSPYGWSHPYVQEAITGVMGLWNTSLSDASVVEAESAIGLGQNFVFDINTTTGVITILPESSDWAELLDME